MDNMNNMFQNNGTNQQLNGGSQNAPGYTLWLVLGIIQIVSFCCCNILLGIFGILTVVFVVNANNAFKTGQFAVYQSKLKSAKIVNIIGWVITFGSTILAFATGIVSGIAEALSNIGA